MTSGVYIRNKVVSEKTRLKMSLSQKKAHTKRKKENPEKYDKLNKLIAKKRALKLSKKLKNNKEFKKQYCETMKKVSNKEDRNIKLKESLKKYYKNMSDEDKIQRYRNKTLRKKLSSQLKNHYLIPENRKKLSDAIRANITPKMRKDRSNRMIRLHNEGKIVSKWTNTKIEQKMEALLKKLKIKFNKQYLIKDIKHKYNADFYLPDSNVVIECDGDYWHNYPNYNRIDLIRNKEMINKGYKVFRFWEHEINNNINMVIKKLIADIEVEE